jgi:hypothetical protein
MIPFLPSFGITAWMRILTYAAVALSIFIAGRAFGIWQERNAWLAREKIRIEAEAEAKRTEAILYARNSEAVAELAKSAAVETEKIKVVTSVIRERVEVYVPSDTPDLPAGWRVLHDAAATGREPDPSAAAGSDAATVPVKDAAETVAENYGSCREDQERLRLLQQYVRDVVLGGKDVGQPTND